MASRTYLVTFGPSAKEAATAPTQSTVIRVKSSGAFSAIVKATNSTNVYGMVVKSVERVKGDETFKLTASRAA